MAADHQHSKGVICMERETSKFEFGKIRHIVPFAEHMSLFGV